ncbi:MAG: polysaccharide deacetylase family protein [Candidatus Symbiothrix sp.]|jgi:peptidoglycan/xylan/chitin deacetylase (PgdA/CDA1 family)|nr:polysaccharide deacetylase family protein [Candidatus Symbiothrix sp.]
MEDFKRAILPCVASLIGLKRLIAMTQEPVIHIFYHVVADEYIPHITPLYKPKTIAEFEADLDYLQKHFRFIGMDDFRRHVIGEQRITQPSIVLSFDDGLRELQGRSAEVLSRRGIPATLFVSSAFVDNRAMFYRHKAALIIHHHPELRKQVLKIDYLHRAEIDAIAGRLGIDFTEYLRKYRPYLTVSDLQEMSRHHYTIGAHSIDHPHFALLSEDEQVRQTLESCAYIKKTFRTDYTCFSFPFSADGVGEGFYRRVLPDVDFLFDISGVGSALDGRKISRIAMEKYGGDARKSIARAYMTRWLKSFRT